MRLLRQAQRRVQRALQFGQVVGIGGFPANVQDRRFMRMRPADFGPAGGAIDEGFALDIPACGSGCSAA
jgi:hypothetical protein